MALLLLISCEPSAGDEHKLSSDEYAKLTKLSDELKVPSVHKRTLLIIPTHGCASCIQAAMEFTARRKDEPEPTVVISGTSSKFSTLMVNKFGIDPARIIIDREGLSLKHGLINIFPVLFRTSGDYTLSKELDANNIHEELTKAGLN